MDIPDSRDYELLLVRTIHNHASEPIDLIFVESIYDWCKQHGNPDRREPAAMAIRDGDTQGAGILLRQAIDESEIESIKGRMYYGGSDEKLVDRLTTPEVFLEHLVLHEVAHLVNDWGQEREDDCDAWAFEKMGWLR